MLQQPLLQEERLSYGLDGEGPEGHRSEPYTELSVSTQIRVDNECPEYRIRTIGLRNPLKARALRAWREWQKSALADVDLAEETS
jgi:hypothetical protein